MNRTALITIILAMSLSGCAAQAPGIQFAAGNATVERTEEDGTVTKTSGAEMSVPFANFLKSVLDAAAKFIPGNGDSGDTVINVNGSKVEVEE